MSPLIAQSFLDNGTLIFWGAIVLMVVVPSIGHYVYRYRKLELETELKRDMVARGMSVEEMERVLKANREK